MDLPRLGLGTWRMGEDPRRRADELRALQAGLERGCRMIDTAEMYGDGQAERIVGEALAGRRDGVALVTKVLPENASREGTVAACEASLRRLRTDRIDLYLLHWAGPHPLEHTIEAFRSLREGGKILAWGVSNFDRAEMERAASAPGGEGLAANQILYNLVRRGPERGVLPWCRERGIGVMAYSPLEQGRLPRGGALARVAARRGATPEQVALAWTVREPGVVAVVKAGSPAHAAADLDAERIVLEREDLAELDREFPAPDREVPLEVL